MNNVAQTSLFAWQDIKYDLGDRQRAVYDALRVKGEMTDKEIAAWLNWPINTVTPRRGELIKLGLIQKAGIRYHNGRPAVTWKTGEII